MNMSMTLRSVVEHGRRAFKMIKDLLTNEQMNTLEKQEHPKTMYQMSTSIQILLRVVKSMLNVRRPLKVFQCSPKRSLADL